MALTLRGYPVQTSKDLFEQCTHGKARDYGLELTNHRYSYNQIPNKNKMVGTIDATSCLGVIYRTSDRSTYVMHDDGRPFESLSKIFDKTNPRNAGPTEVTLIGGCIKGHGRDHSLLNKHTEDHLQKLVGFWQKSAFNFDIQGWAIGEGTRYETLCSDFVADYDNIYLLQQGEVGALNFAMKGTLIPQMPYRMARAISNSENYEFINFQSQKILDLSQSTNFHELKEFADFILKASDGTILKFCSTTPELEPPYFQKMMREMAAYVLTNKLEVSKTPLLKEHVVFCLQGEIVQCKPLAPIT